MPPKKKKARKADSVVWNDNDCRADVCLRPPGTSRWRRLLVAETRLTIVLFHIIS